MKAEPLYFAGIDLGSTMTKVVIIDAGERVLSRLREMCTWIAATGPDRRR